MKTYPAELADLRSIPCAEVTYAAMDLLREGLVASLEIIIGKRCNLLEDGTHKTARVALPSPELREESLIL
jgi:hypothetical protein